MNCKNCKYFNNKVPVDTAHNPNDRHKTAEPYIGKCEKIERIKMMNDSCRLFKDINECNRYYRFKEGDLCVNDMGASNCTCGGDESKCDFYPNKRRIANEKP